MKKIQLHLVALTIASFFISNAQTALDFDRIDDEISTPNNFNLSSFTEEVWVNWDGTSISGQNPTILSGSDTDRHVLWIIAGRVRVGVGHGVEIAVSDETVLPVGVWTHFSVTYDGPTGDTLLYRNGAQVGVEPGNSNSGFILTDLNIGSYKKPSVNTKTHRFGGMIDNVRIWDYVRTPAEIAADYNQCLTGTETGLVAYYEFEDGVGSSLLTDSTGNGHDGTLVDMDPATDWVSSQDSCNTLSITDDLSISNIKIYPNPTSSIIYIDSKNYISSIELYNIIGKRILSSEATEEVDVSHLHRGVYLLKVNSTQGNLTKKVIIE